MQATQRVAQALTRNIGKVVIGKETAIELMLNAILCKGHVLIEDVPGVGKTTLASALARSLDCSFKRIQFTPDITPSDITGFSVVNFKTGELEYKQGLVMSQIVLADEINRTSPKTQSSLLEVMEEGQVTVDGVTYRMPAPFIVLATQNPVDFVGTYPLPEAQLDRFHRLSHGGRRGRHFRAPGHGPTSHRGFARHLHRGRHRGLARAGQFRVRLSRGARLYRAHLPGLAQTRGLATGHFHARRDFPFAQRTSVRAAGRTRLCDPGRRAKNGRAGARAPHPAQS